VDNMYQKHDRNFKLKAIEQVLVYHKSPRAVAGEFGISHNTLVAWIKEGKPLKISSFDQDETNDKTSLNQQTELQPNKAINKLHVQNNELRNIYDDLNKECVVLKQAITHLL